MPTEQERLVEAYTRALESATSPENRARAIEALRSVQAGSSSQVASPISQIEPRFNDPSFGNSAWAVGDSTHNSVTGKPSAAAPLPGTEYFGPTSGPASMYYGADGGFANTAAGFRLPTAPGPVPPPPPVAPLGFVPFGDIPPGPANDPDVMEELLRELEQAKARKQAGAKPGRAAARGGASAAARVARPIAPNNEAILRRATGGAPVRQASFGPQSPSGRGRAPKSGGPNYDYSVTKSPISGERLTYVDNRGQVWHHDSNTNLHSSGALPPTSVSMSNARSQSEQRSSGGGSSGSSSESTVLCTYFMRKGLISRKLWLADAKFSRSLPQSWRVAYWKWAIPTVRRLERGSPMLERIMFPVVNAWAHYAGYRMGIVPKPNLLGWVIHNTVGRLGAKCFG